jgi:deferrochelatase/peroxidase EfeB
MDSSKKTLDLKLTLPLPVVGGPYQNGITDPQWPTDSPEGFSHDDYQDYRGRVSRQNVLAVVQIDVNASSRAELCEVMRNLSNFAYDEMEKGPSRNNLRELDGVPDSYRVTVTIGLGESLFVSADGQDRFGISWKKPTGLSRMPRFVGDASGFDPESHESDLIVVIASDHPYVNIAITRSLAHGYVDKRLSVVRVEQGFSRPDKREFLRFDDGIENLRNLDQTKELDRHIYVDKHSEEPPWCVGGSYLVYRKIREDVRKWEQLKEQQQERAIGRKKATGEPLSAATEEDGLTPIYDHSENSPTPHTAHIRKVQPRRTGQDFMGHEDLSRRFLRRPYPFAEGIDANGNLSVGLHFLAFMKSIQHQFEWVVRLWQTNPDFPEPGIGIDALYAHEIISTVGGGYYFCPPARREPADFIASALFQEKEDYHG